MIRPAADGRCERAVVALVLLGVVVGEGDDRPIEMRPAPEVGRDRDGVTAACVCACERPTAQPTVGRHALGGHLLDFGRALPVAQLAHVEVSRHVLVARLGVQPAEEDVAAGLHQALPGDDPLAMVGELAWRHELLEHRRLRFLQLQEQRFVFVASQQQRDPVAGADAADADDLAREVEQAKLVDQHAAVALEAREV